MAKIIIKIEKEDVVTSKIIIKIEKEDVNTSKIGLNYGIECTNGMSIKFSPEALDELIQDYEHIKNLKTDEEV